MARRLSKINALSLLYIGVAKLVAIAAALRTLKYQSFLHFAGWRQLCTLRGAAATLALGVSCVRGEPTMRHGLRTLATDERACDSRLSLGIAVKRASVLKKCLWRLSRK